MEGPYATPDAFCQARAKRALDEGNQGEAALYTEDCGQTGATGASRRESFVENTKARPLEQHYQGAQILHAGKALEGEENGYVYRCHMSVSIAGKTYYEAKGYSCESAGGYTDDNKSTTITSLDVQDIVPGGAPEVVLIRSVDELGEESSNLEQHFISTFVTICGAGSEGALGCFEVQTSFEDWRSDEDDNISSEKRELRLKYAANSLTIDLVESETETTSGSNLEDWVKNTREYQGQHPISFP